MISETIKGMRKIAETIKTMVVTETMIKIGNAGMIPVHKAAVGAVEAEAEAEPLVGKAAIEAAIAQEIRTVPKNLATIVMVANFTSETLIFVLIESTWRINFANLVPLRMFSSPLTAGVILVALPLSHSRTGEMQKTQSKTCMTADWMADELHVTLLALGLLCEVEAVAIDLDHREEAQVR